MNPTLRKLLLATHVAVSVGWLGAALAYLALAVSAMAGGSEEFLRSAWVSLEVVGWYAIVPLALAALASGIGIAVAGRWGLFRHYWVLTSLLLTLLAAAVLVRHMFTVSFFAGIAAGDSSEGSVALLTSALRGELLHAGLGLLVLLVIEVLNIYKPPGLTAYGRRRVRAELGDCA